MGAAQYGEQPGGCTWHRATDRIEKRVVLRAPRGRVWRALTDAAEFGSWFGAKLERAFAPGAHIRGTIVPTTADPVVAASQKPYAGAPFELTVDRIEPEHLFSFRWHPFAVDPAVDYSAEPMTLVVFELEEVAGGTVLTVVESGLRRRAPRPSRQGVRHERRGVERRSSCAHRQVCRRPGLARPRSSAPGSTSAPLFAALGDVTRLRLAGRLLPDWGRCRSRASPRARRSPRQAVIKHLRILESAGLVRGLRQGRESLWEAEPARLDDAHRCLDLISKQWDEALGRLKTLVER